MTLLFGLVQAGRRFTFSLYGWTAGGFDAAPTLVVVQPNGGQMESTTIKSGVARGPKGNLRNFRAMHADKLQRVFTATLSETPADGEALQAITREWMRRDAARVTA